MSALRRETPESSLVPPANQDDTHTARRGQTAAQKKVLARPHPTSSLILPFWPLELWEVNFCCLEAPLPGALGYTAGWTETGCRHLWGRSVDVAEIVRAVLGDPASEECSGWVLRWIWVMLQVAFSNKCRLYPTPPTLWVSL